MKKYIITAILSIFFLIILIFTIPMNQTTDFSKTFEKYEPKNENWLPIFVLPEKDQKNNGIETVFFNETSIDESTILQITVIFKDEDHPNKLIDKLYDKIREKFLYYRKKDAETFFMTFNEQNKLTEIKFPKTYSEKQKFLSFMPKHFSQTVSVNQFEFENQRPLIYINTWNHLYGYMDNNPETKKSIVKDYTKLQGSRKEIQEYFKKIKV